MYRHLLVTVECAPGGIDAVGHALELARAIGARITFVLAGAAPGPYLPGAQAAEQGAKVEAAARAQGCRMRLRRRTMQRSTNWPAATAAT